MASSRQPSPCALSPSRKTYLGYCFCMDGSLSRHHPNWTDVLGSGVLSWHRGSILASWRPTRPLRAGSLRGHVQSRACSAVAKNIAIEGCCSPSRDLRHGKRIVSWDVGAKRSGRRSRTTIGSEMKRNGNESRRISRTTPLKAGLVQRAEDFCWSSASERSAETSLGAADTSVRATFADRLPPKM
jgi:hypothetical protein